MGLAEGLAVGWDRSVFRGPLAHTLLPKAGVVSYYIVEAPGGVFIEMLEILHADGQLTDPARPYTLPSSHIAHGRRPADPAAATSVTGPP